MSLFPKGAARKGKNLQILSFKSIPLWGGRQILSDQGDLPLATLR